MLRVLNYSEDRIATPSEASIAASRRERWLIRIGFALIFLGAAVIRLWYLNRQIWTAEAWVADSVVFDRVSRMFYDPTWLQTTPPVFLLLERLAVDLIGISNWSLRLIPFTFGLLGVIVMAVLARRIFPTPFALFCTALVALSPPAVEYSKELKQYSDDAAVTALLLLAVWTYWKRPDRRSFGIVLAAFGLTLGLSYTAIMFLPLALIVLLLAERIRPAGAAAAGPIRSTWAARCLYLALPVGILEVIEYLVFVRPNTTPLLFSYWNGGFPPLGNLRGLFHFYAENFAGMPVYFFVGSEGKSALLGVLNALPGILPGVALLACLGGAAALALRFRQSLHHRLVILFCGTPVLTLAALNLVHLYPVGTRRVMLFLLPCVALGLTLITEGIWEALFAPLLGPPAKRRMLTAVAAGSVALVVAGSARATRWRPYAEEDEDAQTAVRYLKAAVKPADRIYVHASMAESVHLYVKSLGWRGAAIVYGNTGWPCCVRDQKTADPVWSNAELQRELRQLAANSHATTVWLLFTGRAAHWRDIGRNDPQIFRDRLQGQGCRAEEPAKFPMVVLYKAVCP